MSTPSSGKMQLLEKAGRRFEMEARLRVEEAHHRQPRVIAISRELGSGGRAIAECIGGRLDWPVWDRQILDAVAEESKLGWQARMFEALDERSQGEIEGVISNLLGQIDKNMYFYLLPKAILTIARSDAVILGRGAHLLLPESLRVRFVASLETRVKNLMRYEGLSEAGARKRIDESDDEREAFISELERRLARRVRLAAKEAEYDLVVNTDHFRTKDVATLVLSAAEMRFGSQLLPRGEAPGAATLVEEAVVVKDVQQVGP